MRIAFALLSLGLVALLAVTVVREDQPEWKRTQRDYYELLAGREADPARAAAIRANAPVVKQIYNPEIGVVDRCTTCHLAIDDPKFAKERQPFTTHPAGYLDKHQPDRVGCVVCHDGQGLATTKAGAHGRVEHWEKPLLVGMARQAACARCHSGHDVPRAPVLSEGMRLVEHSACASCHDLSQVPKRTNVGPNLSHVGDKVAAAWLFDWLANPRAYLARTMMPNFKLSPKDAGAISAYLLTLRGSTLPASPKAFAAAEEAGALERGKQLFERSACTSCHPVGGRGGYDGRLGPDLARVGEKVSRPWLAAWLRDPRRIQPHSRMSAYNFTEEELRALVEYITRTFVGPNAGHPAAPELVAASSSPQEIIRGRNLVAELGCLGCHKIDGVAAPAKAGPELSRFGEKRASELDFGHAEGGEHTLAGFLKKKVLDPRAFGAKLKMPYFGFTEKEADAITVAVLSFARSPMPRHYLAGASSAPAPAMPEGPAGAIARRYQCFSCHALGNQGGRMAPDLATEGSKVKRAFLAEYLAAPHVIRPELKERMPNLRMTPAEIETMTSWLMLSAVSDRIPPDPLGGQTPDAALVAKGKAAFNAAACSGCHNPTGEGPDLSRVGARLEPGWMFAFVKDPTALVPGTTMIDLDLSDEDAKAVTAYLSTMKGAGKPNG